MQFRVTSVIAALLATSAAVSASSSAATVKAHGKAKAHTPVEATRHDIKRLENDLKLLQILKGTKGVTAELERPIYEDLHKLTLSASSHLETVLGAYKGGKRDASFAETTHQLILDLNNVLSKTNKAVKELFENAGEKKLYNEVGVPLGHAVGSTLKTLESKIEVVAPELGKMLDPIVAEVDSDLAFLGIHLRSVSDAEESFSGNDLVERASATHHKLEIKVQAHLHTLTHDLATLERLQAQGSKVNKKELAKVIKAVFKNANEASKELLHVVNVVNKKADGKKRADSAPANEGVFGKLLYRLVHDLVCIIHAVIKLAVNLLGNLGLSEVQELVKEVDSKALEPVLTALKTTSKVLGAKLSPDLDPLLLGVHDLLSKLGLA